MARTSRCKYSDIKTKFEVEIDFKEVLDALADCVLEALENQYFEVEVTENEIDDTKLRIAGNYTEHDCRIDIVDPTLEGPGEYNIVRNGYCVKMLCEYLRKHERDFTHEAVISYSEGECEEV